MAKKESFVFYRSFYEALQNVPKNHRAEVYDAVFAYVFESREPSLTGVKRALWELIRPQLDASLERYAAAVENGKKGAKYGKMGGRPKKNDEGKKNPLRGYAEKPLNDNENHNLNLNENQNGNGNDTPSPPTPVTVGVQRNVSGSVSTDDTEDGPQSIIKEINKGIEKEEAAPPTLEEVKNEAREKGYSESLAERFHRYYSDRGWADKNDKPIKDWKAALRRWNENEKPITKAAPKKRKWGDFDQRSYTESDLESRVLTAQDFYKNSN